MKKLLMLSLGAFATLEAMQTDANALLHEAAAQGDSQLAKYALQCEADVATADLASKDEFHRTALMLARDGQMVKLLLAAGAELEARDHNGWTALTWFSRRGQGQLVKILLAAGAHVTNKDIYGATPLKTAFIYSQREVMLIVLNAETFLKNPLAHIAAHPENRAEYLVWSIAYKKDEAYNVLIGQYPELLSGTQSSINYFLVAARVGNARVLVAMKMLLQKRKPDAARFVFLKVLNLLLKLHPDLVYLVHQVVAEEIAPLTLSCEKRRKLA